MEDGKNLGGRLKGFPNGVQVWGEQTSMRVPKEIVPELRKIVNEWKQKKLEEMQKQINEVRQS